MKVLKFAKVDFYKFKVLYQKGRQGDLNDEAVHLSPFLNSQIPSHVRGGMLRHFALHAFKKLGQILKLELAYHASKFSKLLRRVNGILKFKKTQ